MNSYKKAMDKIVLSEEKKRELLKNAIEKHKRQQKRKRFIRLAASAAACLAVLCISVPAIRNIRVTDTVLPAPTAASENKSADGAKEQGYENSDGAQNSENDNAGYNNTDSDTSGSLKNGVIKSDTAKNGIIKSGTASGITDSAEAYDVTEQPEAFFHGYISEYARQYEKNDETADISEDNGISLNQQETTTEKKAAVSESAEAASDNGSPIYDRDSVEEEYNDTSENSAETYSVTAASDTAIQSSGGSGGGSSSAGSALYPSSALKASDIYYKTPSYLPDGYSKDEEIITSESLRLTYTNSKNQIIYEASAGNTLTESSDYKYTETDGNITIQTDSDNGTLALWTEDDISYSISAENDVSPEEIIKMAQSVE